MAIVVMQYFILLFDKYINNMFYASIFEQDDGVLITFLQTSLLSRSSLDTVSEESPMQDTPLLLSNENIL